MIKINTCNKNSNVPKLAHKPTYSNSISTSMCDVFVEHFKIDI